MTKRIHIVLIGLLICIGTANAQITVNGGLTATQLANIIAGPNIVVTNAQYTGASVAMGTFDASLYNLGMNTGVILSTGSIYSAPGPNISGNTSDNLGTPGTAQMTSLAGAQTYDAITLEFDFTVQSSLIRFNYIFASEEYPEYAPPNSSSFNDVFAFFISGPGITGEENMALIPNTTLPVSIHNVNAITNSQYYIDNTGGQAISFDAYTTVFTAKKEGLIPCQTYHLKLVIADAGDSQYNSAVFLQENSLTQGTVDVTTNTVNSDNIALEGCVDASFMFSLDQPSTQNKVINYTITGTATNGVDYAPIASSVTIPAGQTQAQVFIHAYSDGLTEGQESVYLIYKSAICSPFDTAKLYIDDAQPISYSLTPTNLLCNADHSGQIHVNASGGFPPYTFHVTDQVGNTSLYTSNPITGLDAGNYTVHVYDSYGCKATALVIGGLFNAGTTFLPDGNGVTYTTTLPISGFPPGQMLTSMSMLQNICLNMEHSYLGDLTIQLVAPGGQTVTLKPGYQGGSCDLGEPIATGPIDGSVGSTNTDPGVGYDYCFNTNPMHGTMVAESQNYTRNYTDGEGHSYTDYYLPAGTYASAQSLNGLLGTPLNGNWTIRVTDNMSLDNGYIFNWSISFSSVLPDTSVSLTQPSPINLNHYSTDASCGLSNGAINLSVNGNFPPYIYHWSTGASTQDISGIPSGVYSVTVTDAHGCHEAGSFTLSNTGTMSLSANVTAVTCSGNNTGAVNITPGGGALPYTFAWSNGPTTEDISSLAAGSYTVTVTDQAGCQLIRQFTVNTNPAILINLLSQQNEQCGTQNGEIAVSASGGSGSFGYHWSTGANTSAISGLSGGTYTVTVTDAYGCQEVHTYSIVNDVSNCTLFCYLDVVVSHITDDLCGNGSGTIDVSITGAVQPYVVSWSTGATTEDITGLHMGTYTITVTDANQCVKVKPMVVGNNTGNLTLSNAVISNETCGSGNGAIDITVAGGALPYHYSWSNAATTEDLTDLSAANYTVTVTDANNCKLISTYTVQNNTGNLAANGTVVDAYCSGNNGLIHQTVTGGFGTLSFLWSNNATTQNLMNIPAGNYTCNIMDQGGCTLVKNYTISDLPGDLSVDAIHVTNELCGNINGAIHLSVSGTNPLYVWNTGGTSPVITGLAAGTYTCTIHNTYGCSITTGPIHVFNSPGNLIVNPVYTADEICGNGNGYITDSITGGAAPYGYHWSNGSTSQNIYSLHAGNYTLTVTDANGCQYQYHTIVQNLQGTLVIQNAVVTNETCGNGNGAINLSITGGSLPYTYSWSSGQITKDITGLHAGNYTVTVTSQEGCVQIQNITVNNPDDGMTATWQVTNEICSNGQGGINLTVGGGINPIHYLWSNLATTQDISGIAAGTYSCTISDNNGCNLHTGDITVNNSASNMTATAAVTDEICGNAQGAVHLTVSGGAVPVHYHWSNGATTQNISGLSADTYSYTVTDNNNCQITGSVFVNDNNQGNMNFTVVVTDEHCGNHLGAIDLTVTGGTLPYTYAWNNLQISPSIHSLTAGNYSCTISDPNGCAINTGNITVADNPGNLEIVSMLVTDEVCSNHHGQINLTVSGGTQPYVFNWSNGVHTSNLLSLASGIYIVHVIDANQCTITGQAVVNNLSGAFSISANNITNEHCSNGQGAIDITVQGGTTPYTYLWSTGATTQDISNLMAGTYTVFVQDASGCSKTQSFMVLNEGSNFQISDAVVTDEVCQSASGTVHITLTGGTAPFLYSWSNGSVNEDLSSVHAGTYGVIVTDIFGCMASGSWQIMNLPGTMYINGSSSDENCGNGHGAVHLYVSGGASPYMFSWSNGSTTENINNLHAGSYTVTITDVSGCAGNYTGTVLNNTGGFTAQVTDVIEEVCSDHTGSIDITVSGGTLPYTFVWNTGDTTEDLIDLSEGTYTLHASDTSGCTITLQAVVPNITGTLNISFSDIQDENCGLGDGFIDIEVAGGDTPYTYHWSNGDTTQDIIDLTHGNYTVSVTDGVGCGLVQTYHVDDNNSTNIQITGIVTDDTCHNHTGSINITVTGGLLPELTMWSNGSYAQDQYYLAAGTYTVVVSDDAGCSNSHIFTVHLILTPDCDSLITSVDKPGLIATEPENASMRVYPNPAGSSITVAYSLPPGNTAVLCIYDMEMRAVYSSEITGRDDQRVNTAGFAPGVYNVAIMNKQVYMYEKLVIVR